MKSKSNICLKIICALFAMVAQHASAIDFDGSAGYAPFYVSADSSDVGKASYTRFIGLSLRVGVWTPIGVAELDSLSGIELAPYLQDISVLTVGLRRYWFLQSDFGPEEFWQQASLRKFEPYYSLGLGRLEQQSAFLTQAETIGVLNLKSWGPSAAVGVEWFFGRSAAPEARRTAGGNNPSQAAPAGAGSSQEPLSAVGEVRVLTAIWPESVPAFLFYQMSLLLGIRYRF